MPAVTGESVPLTGSGSRDARTAVASDRRTTMLVLADTTVLIDYLRNAPSAERFERLLVRGDVVCTTAINVEEIVRGLRSDERPVATRLVSGLVIIPIGAREGWQAGEWRRRTISSTLIVVVQTTSPRTRSLSKRSAEGAFRK